MKNKNQLSPENYIRQKSRNLPLHECWISEGWEEDGIAQIVVSRKHVNGNITMGVYLIDLRCLGIKDSFYNFNMSIYEYNDLMQKLKDNLGSYPIDYVQVHNIIYAAEEFAEQYDFKPHPTYTSVTHFLLEEDTDDIELIDIHCGNEKGQPLYVKGPNDSPVYVDQIVKQLEKMAGKGNYEIIIDDLPDLSKEDFSEELEFMGKSFGEKREEFLELSKKEFDQLSEKEFEYLNLLTDHLYQNVVDIDKVDKYLVEWEKELDVEVVNHYRIPEFWGLSQDTKITEQDEQLLLDVFASFNDNPEKAMKKLKDKCGDVALFTFLELLNYKNTLENPLLGDFEKYWNKFPDYPLLKLDRFLLTTKENDPDGCDDLDFEAFFGTRKILTEFEIRDFLTKKLYILSFNRDLESLEAFNYHLDEFVLIQDESFDLRIAFALIRVQVLQAHFEAGPKLQVVDKKSSKFVSDRAFQFKIQIKGITKPPVWRKVLVPENFTFHQFHEVIQLAFGWEDAHLYDFRKFTENILYATVSIGQLSEDNMGEPDENSENITLKDVFGKEGQTCVYIYDFGDNWEHTITLEAIVESKHEHAVCLQGKGTCPPEDCGGVWGYMRMKELFDGDPDDQEAKEIRDWLGLADDENWEEVMAFDIKEVNEDLRMM